VEERKFSVGDRIITKYFPKTGVVVSIGERVLTFTDDDSGVDLTTLIENCVKIGEPR
jgi:hypothetical protein